MMLHRARLRGVDRFDHRRVPQFAPIARDLRSDQMPR
jgi:hypothetical protein